MKFNQVETTYVCQLNKPENRALLERYKNNKDKSVSLFITYYKDIISMLSDTPAWGVAGTNEMINELTYKLRATINKAKKGTTSSFAHAGKLLNKIDFFKDQIATPRYNRCELKSLLTEEELNAFAALD
jgi:hypothetical protein